MADRQADYPRISVVTPSLNQGQFLEETIRSVLGQGYPNLEYLVIDGGSTDGSLEIIQKHADRIAYWRSEPDGGHYEAVNKGLARSTGDIMAWLNADDMFCPWALRTVASVMTAQPGVTWLTSSTPLSWTCGGFCRRINSVAGYSKASFLDSCHLPNEGPYFGWIQQESTFWRRSLWEQSGGKVRTNFRLAGDFDLWARFYDHADLHVINGPLGGFRFQPDQHPERSTNTSVKQESPSTRRESEMAGGDRVEPCGRPVGFPWCVAGPTGVPFTLGVPSSRLTRIKRNAAGGRRESNLADRVESHHGFSFYRRIPVGKKKSVRTRMTTISRNRDAVALSPQHELAGGKKTTASQMTFDESPVRFPDRGRNPDLE